MLGRLGEIVACGCNTPLDIARWRAHNACMQSGHVESPPETKPPFRIESVGHYLRRNRKKARVICVDADADWTVISIDETEPCHEVLVYHHLADGRCYLTEESPNDIVAPWVDPVTEGGR